MSYFEICLLSVGLAMDCFAVSIAGSVAHGRYDWPKMFRMACMFGVFQGAMPLVGWLAGVGFAEQNDAANQFDIQLKAFAKRYADDTTRKRKQKTAQCDDADSGINQLA